MASQGEGLFGAGGWSCRWWRFWRDYWERIGRQSGLRFDHHLRWRSRCGNNANLFSIQFLILFLQIIIHFFFALRLLEIAATSKLAHVSWWLKKPRSSVALCSDPLPYAFFFYFIWTMTKLKSLVTNPPASVSFCRRSGVKRLLPL